jgi:DNA-binding XRE family transcriptional regulator
MPTAPDNHDAHDYAERIRERLPRRLQELRERCGLSMYALWLKCGVSRDTISRIEGGDTIPGVHVLAREISDLFRKKFRRDGYSIRDTHRTRSKYGTAAFQECCRCEH